MDRTPIFILGAGGHSKVLIDCLRLDNTIHIFGLLDENHQLHGKTILGFPVLGNEDDILKNYCSSDIQLVNGVGSINLPAQREKVFHKFKNAGFNFLNVKHPTCYIGNDVILGEGVQVFAGSTIQPGCKIGNNVIVNTHAAIDHDCYIGNHVHFAPGVVCCGGVKIGDGTHIGSGAVLLQGITIGDHCLVASGSVVTRDLISFSKVAGVPAKMME